MSDQTGRERCYICGGGNSDILETHHIVPRRHGGTDGAENLVDLCGNCHSALEKLYDKRFYDALGATPDDGDHEIVGYCARQECYADAEYRVTGVDTYVFCGEHFTCDYDRCDNQPVETLPSPEGENGVCVCEKHRTCSYRHCESEDTGLHRIETGFETTEAKIRCPHHPLDETTTFTVVEGSRPEWEGSVQH